MIVVLCTKAIYVNHVQRNNGLHNTILFCFTYLDRALIFSTGKLTIYIYIYIYMVSSFFLCYTGEALEGPISTGVSNKHNNIDSNNGILISK